MIHVGVWKMNDRIEGTPEKTVKLYKQCKINDYEAMIKEALDAMDEVLNQREKELTGKEWGHKNNKDFVYAFGFLADDIVHIDMPVRGESNLVAMKAKDVVLDYVRRIKNVKKTMSISDFINKINEPREICAKVKGEPQKDYEVEIGINFVGRKRKEHSGNRICMQVTGRDSRVSTLCHELSHIPKIYAYPEKGGIGAGDYDSHGVRQSPFGEDHDSYEGHVAGANLLISKKSELVFDNAYNIERYFEIEL